MFLPTPKSALFSQQNEAVFYLNNIFNLVIKSTDCKKIFLFFLLVFKVPPI